MKKTNVVLVIVLLIAVLVTPLNGFAAEDSIKISINNELIGFNNTSGYPFADSNSRTLVPFRVTLEKFGATVSWNQITKTAIAEKDGIKIEIPLGAKYILKNGERVENDTEAVSIDGKTYLPIRKVMEAFGATVGWNSFNSTVTITSAKPKVTIVEEIKNKDILVYNIPSTLGNPKLSKEEVAELVGKSPSEIQEKINTVYDLLQYMISAGYDDISGDIKLKDGNFTWHSNTGAEDTIRLNKGNCGATSNMANYILKGDYDEVGYINFSADKAQGGHIFNYVKQDDKYYIIDFLQYPLSNYTRYNYKITQLERLEDYPPYCMKSYGNGGRSYQIKVIVSYTAKSQLPIGDNNSVDGVMRYFPKNTNVKVLYETPSEGKVIEFVDGPASLGF